MFKNQNILNLLTRNFYEIPFVIFFFFGSLYFFDTLGFSLERKGELLKFVFSDFFIIVSIILPVIIAVTYHYQKEYLIKTKEIISDLRIFLIINLLLILLSITMYFSNLYLTIELYFFSLILSAIMFSLFEFSFMLGKLVKYLSPEEVFKETLYDRKYKQTKDFIKKILMNDNYSLLEDVLIEIENFWLKNKNYKDIVKISKLYSKIIDEIVFYDKLRFLGIVIISQKKFLLNIIKLDFKNKELLNNLFSDSLKTDLSYKIKNCDDFKLESTYYQNLNRILIEIIKNDPVLRMDFIPGFVGNVLYYNRENDYFPSYLINDLINLSALFAKEDIKWVHLLNKNISNEFLIPCKLLNLDEHKFYVSTKLIRTYKDRIIDLFQYKDEPYYGSDFDEILRINLEFLNILYIRDLEADFAYYMDLYYNLFMYLKENNLLNHLYGTISYNCFFKLVVFYIQKSPEYVYQGFFMGTIDFTEILKVYEILSKEIKNDISPKLIEITENTLKNVDNEKLIMSLKNFIKKLK